jgi:hypothetical protein
MKAYGIKPSDTYGQDPRLPKGLNTTAAYTYMQTGRPPMKIAPQTTMVAKPSGGGKEPPQRVAPQTVMQPKGGGGGGSVIPPWLTGSTIDTYPMADSGYSDALSELAQSMLTDSASQSFDYESALQQSQKAIQRAYAAEINAIRGNNRRARKDTKKARNELENMYQGLAQAYGLQSQQSTQLADQRAAQSVGLANDANSQIRAMQMQTTADQAQLMRDLGMPETADQIVTPDFKQVAETQAKVTQEGASNAQLQSQLGDIDSRYYKRGKRTAQLEGTNRSADLLGELQGYIRGNRDQIASLKGQRAKEKAANRQSTMAAAQEAEANAQSELWDRVMQFAQMQADMSNTNFDNSLAAAKFQYQQQDDRRNAKIDWKQNILDNKLDWKKAILSNRPEKQSFNDFLPASMQNAVGLFQSGQSPQKLMAALTTLTQDQRVIQGQFKAANGEFIPITQSKKMQLAREYAKKLGLSTNDENILVMAVMGMKDL